MEYTVKDRLADDGFRREFGRARRYIESSEEPADDNLPYEIFELLRNSRIGSYSFDNPERYVLGWEEDELVAMGSLQRNDRPRTLEEPAVELYHLVVEEEKRGEGWGSATFDELLDEARDVAADEEVNWLYMQVSSFSEPAQHLAREYGFEKVDETSICDFYACEIDELED